MISKEWQSTQIILFVTGLFLIIAIHSCDRTDPEIQKMEKGKSLARIHCVSCHDFPDSDLLTKSLWGEILPTMGAKMGIAREPLEIRHMHLLLANDLMPAKPLLTEVEWEMIQWYYIESSEDSFVTEKTQISDEELTLFEEKPVFIGESRAAASLVKFGPDPYEIWYGDGLKNKFYRYNLQSNFSKGFDFDGAPSHVHFRQSGFRVLTMGNIHPNDLRKGKIFSVSGDHSEILVEGLPRPVHASYGDLNGDQQEDILISGFGYLLGSLSWYEHKDGDYQSHVLRNLPGAIKTDIIDLDKDGFIDILALMAQGDEGFFFYKGDGKGSFKEKKIISFPSSYGSSYYELADLNGDGFEDIIYVNGDNGDYSAPVIKPYHGVRIFMNQSENDSILFSEYYYYSMNGAFKAMAEDYDLDGDLDIICISYFPDYEHTPQEGIIYLENNGGPVLNFTPKSIRGSLSGKWLVADRKDYDGDGDIDVVLGNSLIMSLNVPQEFKEKWEKDPVTVLVLENKTR